ncbi:MAG: 2-phospho-L-lactate transferase [Chloroflexi bacterium]|nr:2-phospho-L-lactate transferase [Chloroflexota bacterium]
MRQTTILAFAGGVGGAKLALGLARSLPPDQLTIVVNTGDDFEHLGWHISPDLDTVMYTLAGLSNPETGWGLAGESWNFLDALDRLGGEAWFRLGDCDLATHAQRTRLLGEGLPLSAVTRHLCERLGVTAEIVPMSDDPVRTIVHTDDGPLPFQEYFVHRRCEPRVRDFEFLGLPSARPQARLLEALAGAEMLIYCPSNPYVSIAPIVNLPGLQPLIASRRAAGMPVVAVSPIVGGAALKGPAAKMMTELGLDSTVIALAEHYAGTIDGLVLDVVDAASAPAIELLGLRTLVTNTIMATDADKIRLAQETVEFALSLKGHGDAETGRRGDRETRRHGDIVDPGD